MAIGKKKKKPKLQKWNDCNLIQFRESEARLWHFTVSEKQVTQKSQLTHSESTPLPQAQACAWGRGVDSECVSWDFCVTCFSETVKCHRRASLSRN